MAKRVLLVATVQSHICQFHKPLMRLLKEEGWVVHVAARNNLAEKNGLAIEYADKVFDIPFSRSPISPANIHAYKALRNVLKQNTYDVIHTNTPVGGVLGRFAASKYRKRGTRVFYTAHGFHFYKGAPIKNWIVFYPIEKVMARFTDKLITITEEDYNLAKHKFHCPVFRIHGVGVDASRFKSLEAEDSRELRRELNLSGHIILNVGELLPNKNQKIAIEAAGMLLDEIPDVHLLIAGNGPERANLERLVGERKLEGRVIFLGYTTQVHKYMQACDALVSCSYREGLPLNVVEAMLCGKPVVASNNRGHRELVQNGKTGFLVDPNDERGFADSLVTVLADPNLYRIPSLEHANLYRDKVVRQELGDIYTT